MVLSARMQASETYEIQYDASRGDHGAAEGVFTLKSGRKIIVRSCDHETVQDLLPDGYNSVTYEKDQKLLKQVYNNLFNQNYESYDFGSMERHTLLIHLDIGQVVVKGFDPEDCHHRGLFFKAFHWICSVGKNTRQHTFWANNYLSLAR
jgi:hypothetical protein